MTARPQTVAKAAVQREVIAALRATSHTQVAERLQKCAEVRLSRRHGSGWPKTCRNSGCIFCGPALARRWWRGIERWIVGDDTPVSLAVLPLSGGPASLRARVARTRRALRDVRDRAARRRAPWGGVAVAGMVTGNGTAFVLVSHPGAARQEVAAVLRRRWPAAVVGAVGAAEPSWSMPVEDAAELARARRGVEPLRIIVLEQRAAKIGARNRTAKHGPPVRLEPVPVAL